MPGAVLQATQFEAIAAMLALIVLFAAFAVPLAARRRAREMAAWESAAAGLGLTFMVDVIQGRMGDFEVLIKCVSGANDRTHTRIVLQGGLPADVEIRRAGSFHHSLTPDEKIGDPAVDETVHLGGAGIDLVRGLAAPVRSALRDAVAQGWTLERGVFTADYPGILTDDLEAALRIGLGLAAELRKTPAELRAQLVLRVHDDPHTDVRRTALEVLATGRHGAEALWEALAFALADVDHPDLRFRAARIADDVPTLVALAESGHPPALLALSGKRKDVALLRRVLAAWVARGVSSTDAALAFATVVTAIPLGPPAPVEAVEPVLKDLLAHEADDVNIAAARALAVVGTVAAVPALAALRERLRWRDLRFVARDAILAIQARAAGAEVGALALTEVPGGALALATKSENETEPH